MRAPPTPTPPPPGVPRMLLPARLILTLWPPSAPPPPPCPREAAHAQEMRVAREGTALSKARSAAPPLRTSAFLPPTNTHTHTLSLHARAWRWRLE